MIREYLDSDRETVEKFIIELQNFEKSLNSDRAIGEVIAPPYLQQILDNIKNKNGQLLIAEVDGNPAGFISFWIEEDYSNLIIKDKIYGFISDIFVTPEHRENGIGKTLMIEAESYFRTKGILNIRLYCLASNRGASEFYEDLGFRDYENLLVKHIF